MIIDGNLPKFDLPIDFIADDSITGDILNMSDKSRAFYTLYGGNCSCHHKFVGGSHSSK